MCGHDQVHVLLIDGYVTVWVVIMLPKHRSCHMTGASTEIAFQYSLIVCCVELTVAMFKVMLHVCVGDCIIFLFWFLPVTSQAHPFVCLLVITFLFFILSV